jgi:predicted PurR-regulated permease PerM
MPKKKNNPPNFRTIRIFGERAQRLIDTAKVKIQEAKEVKRAERDERSARKYRDDKKEIVIKFSLANVVKVAVLIIALYLLKDIIALISDTLVIFFLAIFLAVIIDPGVSFIEKLGVPRGFAVILVYLLVITLLTFLISSFIPIIAEQVLVMAKNVKEAIETFAQKPRLDLPFLTAKLNSDINVFLEQLLIQLSSEISADSVLGRFQQFEQQLSVAAHGSLNFAVTLAGSVIKFIVKLVFVLVLAFFFQIEKERVLKWVRSMLPYRYRRYMEGKAEAIHLKLAQWIQGQIMLSMTIGVMVFTLLTILGMPYALTLAVLAAFTEFVPVIGPIVAAIPAILIALAQVGFVSALIVSIGYYGIQWCENNLLVPLIMKRAVGLSPIVVIFAMMVGVSFPDRIHPVLGVLLAVPTATIISVFIKDIAFRANEPHEEGEERKKK